MLCVCVCVCVCVAQSCPTLCDAMGCISPSSPVHGILQAGIVESIAISWWRLPRKGPLLNGAVCFSLAEKQRQQKGGCRSQSDSALWWPYGALWFLVQKQSEFFILNYLPACNAGDPALIPGLGRSPGERNGNLLENSMDRGGCWATVHEVTKSQIWLSY